MTLSMRTIKAYMGKNGRWYWRATAKGRIVEDGSQGYASKRNVMRAIQAKLRATYVVK